jgi:hypothetical protein
VFEKTMPRKSPDPFELPRSYQGDVWGRLANIIDPPPDPFWDDPNAWSHDCVEGWDPTFYQTDILRALAELHRASVRGPHGLGKTGIAAIAALWFADTRDRKGADWKVVTTAGVWRQLKNYLWPEIHKWGRRLKHRQFNPRTELLTLELRLGTGSAFPVASDDEANIEGAHADEILYIIDEGKNVPTPTWDAIEGALSTGNAYVLAISTPGRAEGRFYEIHQKKAGTEDWWVKHVTLEDAISAGRISRDWADARRTQWGEGSPVFQNRVLGEFSTLDMEGIIPLDWVEAANDRWEDLRDAGAFVNAPLLRLGVDVARGGKDQTIFAPFYQGPSGLFVPEIRYYKGIDTMETAGRIKGILEANPGAFVVPDVVGVGGGVVDRLREQNFQVDAFNASEASKKKDRSGELGFYNRRAEAWWKVREALDPAFGPTLALPPDDQLIGDLTSPRWDTAGSRGLIKVEAKDDVRRRLGRSPDVGDAVVMGHDGTLGEDAGGWAPVSLEGRSTWARRDTAASAISSWNLRVGPPILDVRSDTDR